MSATVAAVCFAILLVFAVGALALQHSFWREREDKRDEHWWGVVARIKAVHDEERARLLEDADFAVEQWRQKRAQHEETQADLEWARILLVAALADADMYRTAFTAVMLNQVRADLIELDAPAGVADVIEFPTPKRGA